MTLMDAPAIPATDGATRIGCVVAVVSMLHQPAERNSGTRTFRGKPVLEATLQRLAAAGRVGAAVVLCWDDQAEAIERIVGRVGNARNDDAGLPPLVPSPLYAGERVRVRGRSQEERSPTTGVHRGCPSPPPSPRVQGRGGRHLEVPQRFGAHVISVGPRVVLPHLDAITAARRWAGTAARWAT